MILHLRDPDATATGGVLYVTVGESAFPEEGWYDRVTDDLENWLPRIISFARAHTDSCALPFMDGPAVIRLTRRGECVIAACLWDQKPQIPEGAIDFHAFLDSTARCVRQYNLHLHNAGKPIRFEAELSALKTILKS